MQGYGRYKDIITILELPHIAVNKRLSLGYQQGIYTLVSSAKSYVLNEQLNFAFRSWMMDDIMVRWGEIEVVGK
jgi:hypothetical protein